MVRFRLNILAVLALIALAACSDGSEPTQALRSEVRAEIALHADATTMGWVLEPTE